MAEYEYEYIGDGTSTSTSIFPRVQIRRTSCMISW